MVPNLSVVHAVHNPMTPFSRDVLYPMKLCQYRLHSYHKGKGREINGYFTLGIFQIYNWAIVSIQTFFYTCNPFSRPLTLLQLAVNPQETQNWD